MRGTVLGFDPASGTGVITDAGGARVNFSREEWKSPGEPLAGRHVDFELEGDRAVGIFLIPGSGSAFDFSGQDVAQSAMTAGIVSLVCAVLSFVLGPLGPFTLIVAIIFGIKGKNAGRDLPDKTAYYLSLAGLWISGIALVMILLVLATCTAAIGWLGVTGTLFSY